MLDNFCMHCDYKCGKKDNLRKHIKAVHDRTCDFNCSQCKYKSSRKSHLKTHIKAVHEKAKDHFCPYCDYKSARKDQIKTHMKTCKGNRMSMVEIRCNLCDHVADNETELTEHLLFA